MNRMKLFTVNGDSCSVVRKNQTTNEIITCSEIVNSYLENPGFSDFVEVTR